MTKRSLRLSKRTWPIEVTPVPPSNLQPFPSSLHHLPCDHILVGLFCAIAVGLGYFLSSGFTTAPECNFFTEVFVYALVVDLVLIQSFSVLLTYFYRWMVAEPDESLWAELHPAHREERSA